MASACHALCRSASSARPSAMSECGRQASSRGTAHRWGRSVRGAGRAPVCTPAVPKSFSYVEWRLPAGCICSRTWQPVGKPQLGQVQQVEARGQAARNGVACCTALIPCPAHVCRSAGANGARQSSKHRRCTASPAGGGGRISSGAAGGAVLLHPRTALSTRTFGRPPRPQGACDWKMGGGAASWTSQ